MKPKVLTNFWSIALVGLVACASAQAGQSINLSGRHLGNSNFPSQPRSNPWRVEMYVHDWDNANFRIADLTALGARVRVFVSGDQLILEPTAYFWHSSESNGCLFRIDQLPVKGFYLRLQRDPAKRLVFCEAWDVNGQRFGNHTQSFVEGGTFQFNGIFAGADGLEAANRSLGFLRIHNSLVPLNSRPPVFRDDEHRLLEWKFDGNRNDSAANFNASVLGGGNPPYTATPGQDKPVSKVKVAGAPFWSDWVSLRAGFPAELDGRSSYGLADASAAVSYEWRQLSGPTTLIWDDRTAATPKVKGLVFGTYRLGLTVVDSDGNRAASETEIGAVAHDERGVVVHADENVEKIFGPMIAFGKNPWEAVDDAHLRGAKIRSSQYDTVYAPEWKEALPGKIDYVATSDAGSAPRQTLTAAITANAMTIPLNGVSNLNFSSFPTLVSIDLPGYGGEEILICGLEGNSLTVCYDGRGYGFSNARSWSSGASVFHRRVEGTDTNFLTTFCPAGPGLSGPVTYATGTVSATADSAQITGTSTVWNAASGVYPGQAIRIEGTHGGEPFVFFAVIHAIGGTGQITMNRPWPADADSAGNLTYHLLQFGQYNLAPHWTRPDGTEGQTLFGLTACVSNSAAFLRGGLEVVKGVQTGKEYGKMVQYWLTQAGNGTPNFYDEVLANYALYFRSGWDPARTAARKIGDFWTTQPLIDEGWGAGAGIPRNLGVTGVVAATVLDERSENWYTIRRLAASAVTRLNASCDDDLRELAYIMSWLALAANFDPLDTGNPEEPGQRSYWRAKLADNYNRDFSCRGADNSFPSGLYFNNGQFPPLTVTGGSTAVTGTGFSASMCPTQQSGTGMVVTGSATLVITGSEMLAAPVGMQTLVLTGTRNGQPYTLPVEWSGQGSQVTLAVKWIGDTGPVTWMRQSDENISIIASGQADPTFGTVYACTFNSANSLTLNRPYAGASGTAYLYRSNVAGRGVQPFMAGIKTLQMLYAAQGAQEPTASAYRQLAAQAGDWVIENGFDRATGGLFYARGFEACEPVLEASQQGFRFRNLGCAHGTGRDDRNAARALLAEAQSAVRAAYESNPSEQTRQLGDEFYANQWGIDAFTRSGYRRTDMLENPYATDSALGFGKWYGFQFGVGMAHQWPAVRVGGAQPPVVLPGQVNFLLNSVEGAVSVKVKLLAPTGKQTEYSCEQSPCAVELDGRIGDYWYQIEYRSSTGEVLATSMPELVRD